VKIYRWNLEQSLAFVRARSGRLARLKDPDRPTIRAWIDDMAARDFSAYPHAAKPAGVGQNRSMSETVTVRLAWGGVAATDAKRSNRVGELVGSSFDLRRGTECD
jgi:hypothetical protein